MPMIEISEGVHIHLATMYICLQTVDLENQIIQILITVPDGGISGQEM